MVPTIRQGVVGSLEHLQNDDTWIIRLPNDTLAHNSLQLFIEANSGVTIVSVTSTDVDGNATGDNWAQVIRVSLQQSAIAWMATDINAGTRTITVVLNQLDTYMQFNAFEVAYVSTAEVASALDGPASSATGISGNTVSSGAITTTQDGSILFQFAFDCSQLFATSLVKGSKWTLLGAQCVDGVALQYQVQTTHGAITPTLTRTTGSASNYNTIAYAVKADPTKGDHSLPNGSVRFIQHHCPRGKATFTLQFPCVGNCILVANGQGDPAVLTEITDSNSNSYAQTTFNADATQHVEQRVAANSLPSTDLTVTFSYSATSAHGMLLMYDIVGAAASPIGAMSIAAGSQSVNADLATVSITPQAQNSVVVFSGVIYSHTTNNLLGGVKWFGDMMVEPLSNGADISLDEADSWGHYYNESDVSTQTATWKIQNNTGGVDGWVTVATEIKSAQAGGDGMAGQAERTLDRYGRK